MPLTGTAGSYPGQAAPIRSVGSWLFVMARPGLADDVGYRLARRCIMPKPRSPGGCRRPARRQPPIPPRRRRIGQ
jgi:hypothetical protein